MSDEMHLKKTYQIMSVKAKDEHQRASLIANGFVPKQRLKLVRKLFGGRYWVVRLNGRLVGVRGAELQQLELNGEE